MRNIHLEVLFVIACVQAAIAVPPSCYYQSSCVCAAEYSPVCGSDGFSYANPCVLLCAAQSSAALKQVSCGLCPCVCRPDPLNEVCGEDGKTYRNRCQLDCAKVELDHNGKIIWNLFFYVPRERNGHMNVSYSVTGACPAVCECQGERRGNRKVCASNGTTYPNLCEYRCAKRTNPALEIVSMGQCSSVVDS